MYDFNIQISFVRKSIHFRTTSNTVSYIAMHRYAIHHSTLHGRTTLYITLHHVAESIAQCTHYTAFITPVKLCVPLETENTILYYSLRDLLVIICFAPSTPFVIGVEIYKY